MIVHTFVKTSRRSKDQNNIQSHKEPSPEIKGVLHTTFKIRPFGSLIELPFSHLSIFTLGERVPVSKRTVDVAFV